jgi:phosphate transport system permease protein
MKFRTALAVIAGVLPASIMAVLFFLADYSWPAVRFNGIGFVTGNVWNLGNLYGSPIVRNGVQTMPGAHYGILFLIVGTLLSTAIALVLAVPIGVGAAVFLAEAVPGRLRLWLSFFVELLAAVPSVVFGLWGYAVLIPLLGHHIFPWVSSILWFVPFFGPPYGSGYGLLTAGLVLSLMIVPLIAATLRDAIVAEPMVIREAAAAMGATRFETVWKVVLPGLRKVLIGSTILATGRALGETMAVLMVSGNALNYLPPSIYSPISTMAAFIVSQLDSALQDPSGLAVRSLAEVALVLSVISIAVNAIARVVLYGSGRAVGRA